MKRSKVPFSVRYNRFLDFSHKSVVLFMAGTSAIMFLLVSKEALHMKYVRHPEFRKKEQKLLSKEGETI